MKNKGFLIFALAVLLFAGLGYGSVQRGDLASSLSGTVALIPASRANTAATSAAIDIANLSRVALAVVYSQDGDSSSSSIYVVIEDSIRGLAAAGSTWTAYDSVLIDSAVANYEDLHYGGNGRYLRVIQRASGGAADTMWTAAVILGVGRSRN
jgi:hypothetical protein